PRLRRHARCRPRRYFRGAGVRGSRGSAPVSLRLPYPEAHLVRDGRFGVEPRRPRLRRSEEHTSELQSRFDLVCRLLLEKKKCLTSPLRAPKFTTASSDARCVSKRVTSSII